MPIPVPALLLGGGVLATLIVLSKREAEAATGPGGGGAPAALPPAGGFAPATPTFVTPAFVPQPQQPQPSGPVVLPPLPGGFLTPPRPTAPVIAPQQTIAQTLANLGIPPSNVPQPPGTIAPTMQDLIDSLRDPANFQRTHPNVSFDAVTEEQLQAAHDALSAQNIAAATQGVGPKATVTTNDPAPAGDLIMRVAPNDASPMVPGGGAEKGGQVTIVNPNASFDGVWAEIFWPGGSRRPSAKGFAKKKFLAGI